MVNRLTNFLFAVLVFSNIQAQTVVDVVVNSSDHEILETAVIAAGLAPTLSDTTAQYTVFAPTDAAFSALPAGVIDSLLVDPTGDLTDILLYHVLGAEVLSSQLSDGQVATTLFGEDITVSVNQNMVMINNALVTVADIQASNGVVHVIDAVLLPTAFTSSVVDIIVNSADHTTLEAAVLAAGLDQTLADPNGSFTVFAPTDAAFATLPAGTIDDLLDDPNGSLTDVLTYHVLGTEVFSADLSDGQQATTLLGEDVTVTINAQGVFINQAQVTLADIQANNGVVHVIDAPLLPNVITSNESIKALDNNYSVIREENQVVVLSSENYIDQVLLYDITGKEIFSSNKATNRISVNASDLSDGIFFLSIRMTGKTYTEKIVLF